jgi:hypothetical protein
MRFFLFSTFALASLLGLGACANPQPADARAADTHLQQNLRIDVLDASGKPLNGLACRLANEHGYVLAQSGGTVAVKRSARDLDIDCDAPQGQHTQAQLRPRPESGSAPSAPAQTGSNTSVFGSIGLGSFGSRGGVGVNIGFPLGGNQPRPVVSDTAAAAWRYPDWVQLRQGKTLLFDAQGSSSAQPALGYEAVRPSGKD